MTPELFADAQVPAITFNDVERLLLCWLAVAGVGAIGAVLLWRFAPTARGSLLPPQRLYAVPWGFLVIIASECLDFLWPAPFLRTLNLLWATVVAFPFQAASILLLLLRGAKIELYQIGLSCHRWAKDLLSGYLLFTLITPITYAVFIGVALLVQEGTPHQVEALLKAEPTVANWLAAWLLAVLARPFLEELVFRALLQKWLVKLPFAADVVVLASLLQAISMAVMRDLRHGSWTDWWPVVFLVVVGPSYVLFELGTRRWLNQPGVARAIFASSLIFAAFHADAWPTPIPLFFLALGLGWLAQRTQSIVGCIACHGLFNAVGMLELMDRVLWHPVS